VTRREKGRASVKEGLEGKKEGGSVFRISENQEDQRIRLGKRGGRAVE